MKRKLRVVCCRGAARPGGKGRPRDGQQPGYRLRGQVSKRSFAGTVSRTLNGIRTLRMNACRNIYTGCCRASITRITSFVKYLSPTPSEWVNGEWSAPVDATIASRTKNRSAGQIEGYFLCCYEPEGLSRPQTLALTSALWMLSLWHSRRMGNLYCAALQIHRDVLVILGDLRQH